MSPASYQTAPPRVDVSIVDPLPVLQRAGNGTRTRDPNLGKVVLYQLSYSREQTAVLGRHICHGGEGNRTPDLLNAIQALSQLSYTPGITLAVSTRPDRNREGYPRVVSMSRKSHWQKHQRPVSCSASIP